MFDIAGGGILGRAGGNEPLETDFSPKEGDDGSTWGPELIDEGPEEFIGGGGLDGTAGGRELIGGGGFDGTAGGTELIGGGGFEGAVGGRELIGGGGFDGTAGGTELIGGGGFEGTAGGRELIGGGRFDGTVRGPVEGKLEGIEGTGAALFVGGFVTAEALFDFTA